MNPIPVSRTPAIGPGHMALGRPAPRLVRRNGEEVAWNAKKIEKAVGEAFVAQQQDPFPTAREIARTITQRVSTLGTASVALEQVQDLVQEELMRRGHFKVAEAYILYRSEHAKLRRQKPRPAPEPDRQESFLLLQEADGQSRLWTVGELRPRIAFAARELDLPLSSPEIARRLGQTLRGEWDQPALEAEVLRQAWALIPLAPECDVFAARLRWSFLYSRLLGWDPAAEEAALELERSYRGAFPGFLKKYVEAGLLHPGMLAWDLEKLAAALDVAADGFLDSLAAQELADHYLLRDGETGGIVELPQFLWMRVAMGIFLSERPDRREADVLALYHLLKDRRFCVAPTALSYAGTPRAQMLSAYTYQLRDDLESIMAQGIADSALAVKWGASLSGSWTSVRGFGSPIRGTRQTSAGVIPFLELHRHQLALARPSGERPGIYGSAALELWHADIEAFIDFRTSGGGQGATLGTELWIPDLFLERVGAEGDWTLFRVEEVRHLLPLYGEAFRRAYEELEQRAREGRCWSRTLPAAGLWGRILARIYEDGFPRIAFRDRCNGRHMLAPEGTVGSSGVGSELLLHSAPEASLGCPVGVLALPRHLDASGDLDRSRLRHSVRLAVRALDAMLDANHFPSASAGALTRRYRPIALGLVGLQDVFLKKHLAFDAPEARAFQEECLEVLAYDTIGASVDLAQEKGPYPRFASSLWARGKFPQECGTEPSPAGNGGGYFPSPGAGGQPNPPAEEVGGEASISASENTPASTGIFSPKNSASAAGEAAPEENAPASPESAIAASAEIFLPEEGASAAGEDVLAAGNGAPAGEDASAGVGRGFPPSAKNVPTTPEEAPAATAGIFSAAEAPATLDWEALRRRLGRDGLRNAYLMALPAAESAARLMACYPGVLPATRYVFREPEETSGRRAGGGATFPAHAFVDYLKSAGVWTAEIYEKWCRGDERAARALLPPEAQKILRTAFELDPESLLQAAAGRQRWIDQSQCLELYLPTPNMAALSSLYRRAWELGLKTLRTLKVAPLPAGFGGEAAAFSSLEAAMAGLQQGMSRYDF